ncbi:enoyl-CoA hydratase/isomerase family protein [Pseudomonas gingeri]|uniref:enoyl-CoA hydratase-related protein n=1 Tax=Pseudomonas gingeri TaxID=117681 RepID=UPI0015A1FC3D|nr:enoyl-CoA hydratase-related protein [Pseudomonas gingeri]NWD66920.1 enoyl-CoA hydratase/isomerase family protein [Pseudomonas gingeri]
MTESKSESTIPVLVRREGAVGIVHLNRPQKRNVLDLAMRAAIAQAVAELEVDEVIRAIVITGGEHVFAAGADLNLLVDKNAQQVEDLDLGQYWAPLINSRKPLIAAVSGFALGAGCELAMMCDIIVAQPNARFGQPELKVGIMPGAGGTQRLIRAVGKSVASLMLLSGELLTGERAWQLGLVAELTADGEVVQRAIELARHAAAMPPKAVRAVKRILDQGPGLPLNLALALENREFVLLFDTQDKREGMQAFLDKRQPVYSGQ